MMMYKSYSLLTAARTTTDSMELYNNNDNTLSLLQAVIEAFISIDVEKMHIIAQKEVFDI